MTQIAQTAGCQALADLLHPFPLEEFLENTFGQTYAHISGASPDRFEALLSWDALNGILERHSLEPPRIRLAKDSRNIPASSFISSFTDSRGRRVTRIRPGDVRKEIEAGATLVIDAVDELHRPISQLAFGLEQVFQESVQINAYLGSHPGQGFETHWDTHDVLILQLFGRKNWRIYGTSRKYAIEGDSQFSHEIPQPPLWTGALEPGDVLYIPRAWWHDATCIGEPTLHLTVGIHNATGMDFVAWLGQKLRESEIVRRDLPRFAPPRAQRDHLSALRDAVSDALMKYGLQAFYSERAIERKPRPHSSLPWTLAPDLFPLKDSMRVRFAMTHPPAIHRRGEQLVLHAAGNEWQLSESMADLLRKLGDGAWHGIGELRVQASSSLDGQIFSPLLSELLRQGLLELERE